MCVVYVIMLKYVYGCGFNLFARTFTEIWVHLIKPIFLLNLGIEYSYITIITALHKPKPISVTVNTSLKPHHTARANPSWQDIGPAHLFLIFSAVIQIGPTRNMSCWLGFTQIYTNRTRLQPSQQEICPVGSVLHRFILTGQDYIQANQTRQDCSRLHSSGQDQSEIFWTCSKPAKPTGSTQIGLGRIVLCEAAFTYQPKLETKQGWWTGLRILNNQYILTKTFTTYFFIHDWDK
jgi:hypothetical protein